MSNELQRDIDYINSIISKENKELFSKVYTETNEPLNILFKDLNLTGKRVYSVLSSSDYLYMSYLHGTNSIDCFDINPITYRYYYLRKWLIENNILSIGYTNLNEIITIINKVTPNSIEEKESIIFWKYTLSKMQANAFVTSMFQDYLNNTLWVSHYNPFIHYYNDKLDSLKSYLSSTNPNFTRIDISKARTNKLEYYDYIFLSNILDYHRGSKEDLLTIKKYLLSLLKDNGKVLCLHIDDLSTEIEFLRKIKPEINTFKNDLEYSFISSDDYGTNHYYQYTKK